MKTHRSDARRALEHRAAASSEDAPLQPVQAAAAGSQRSLQGGIDQSPRMQAQRRAIQAAFGNTFQRRSTVNTQGGDAPVQRIQVVMDGELMETDHYSLHTLRRRSMMAKMPVEHLEALKKEMELRSSQGLRDPILAPALASKEKEAKRHRTLAKNLEARALVRKMLEEGLKSGDPILKNSCEYAISRAKKVYAITVLEENYDVLSEAVRTEQGSSSKGFDEDNIELLEDYVLLYPKAESQQDPCDVFSMANPGYQIENYSTLSKDPQIGVEASRRTKGWELDGAIAIVVNDDEASTRSYLYETLKHEVQHSVDGSNEETAGLGKRTEENLMALALARFKTEYRAFYTMDHARVRELRQQGTLNNRVVCDYDKDLQVTELQNVLFTLALNDMKEDFFMRKSDFRRRAKKEGPHDPMLIFETHLGKFVKQALLLDPLREMINPFNSVRIARLYGALQGTNLTAIRQSFWMLEKQEAAYIRTDRAAKQKIAALLSKFSKESQDLIKGWIPHAGT